MSITAALDRFRLLVCVGTGGVGKTTLSAALALAAALRGKRALVLTIDPARALSRALGLEALGAEQVIPAAALAAAGLAPRGVLAAAMLDQKQAWDAFVARHAPSAAVGNALLANPFYQRLSTSFAGSTEYMAVEEMCRLAESGAYDLIVLDTPPSAHALDFLHAPDRIDRLLGGARGFGRLGRNAFRSAGLAGRMVLARLEHAAGRGTLRDISAFFAALEALVEGILTRTRRARALLGAGDAAFVLVTAPRQLELAGTRVLVDKLAAQPAPLAAVAVNRVHEVPDIPDGDDAGLAVLGDDPPARWLRDAWQDAVAEVADERAVIDRFVAMMPRGIPLARIAEADHDLCSLADLAAIVQALEA
jgi:anion-transporting  ArsA/GET3 family ATPase